MVNRRCGTATLGRADGAAAVRFCMGGRSARAVPRTVEVPRRAETLYRCREMNVADLVRVMETIAPTRFAAPWDNVGLLVGDPAREIARVLLSIDCTRSVVD